MFSSIALSHYALLHYTEFKLEAMAIIEDLQKGQINKTGNT